MVYRLTDDVVFNSIETAQQNKALLIPILMKVILIIPNLNPLDGRQPAKAEVFDYIERFNNPKRRQPTLGYLYPIDCENKVGPA